MNPQAVDWNNDGMDDFILGDMSGYVNFFRRNGDGIYDLDAAVHVQVGGEDIDVEYMAGPACVLTSFDGTRTRLDWDEDGLYDMVVGCQSLTGSPTLRLFLNSGSNEEPVFESFSFIMAGGSQIYESRINPHVVDLDGDGMKDIIAGNHGGGIIFFQNIGTNDCPVFGQPVSLHSQGQPIDIDTGSKVWPEDMNGDGILDILASDYTGQVYVFPGEPSTGLEEGGSWGDQQPVMRILGSPVRGGSIDLEIDVSSPQRFELEMYDASGRLVCRDDLGMLYAGTHSHTVYSHALSSGVYLIWMMGESASCSSKVLVMN